MRIEEKVDKKRPHRLRLTDKELYLVEKALRMSTDLPSLKEKEVNKMHSMLTRIENYNQGG